MRSKARIIQTSFAVLLIAASFVIFFWEYISVIIFPRTEYEKPVDASPAVTTPVKTATPRPTATPTHEATPTATPEPTPTPKPTMLEKWSESDVYKANSDLQGWLSIPHTKIDYPVVMATEDEDVLTEDGFYYLHNNFDKEKDEQGAIFLYPGSDILENRRNLSIFGHNMRNLRMFGTLKYYNYLWSNSALEQYQKSPLVHFDTIYGDGVYKMFAFIMIDETEPGFLNFMYDNFRSEDEFMSFVGHLQARSMIVTGVDVEAGDELLTLVSCTSASLIDQGKFVIVARKVRDGESIDVDVESAYFNPNAIMPAILQKAWSKKVPIPAE